MAAIRTVRRKIATSAISAHSVIDFYDRAYHALYSVAVHYIILFTLIPVMLSAYIGPTITQLFN